MGQSHSIPMLDCCFRPCGVGEALGKIAGGKVVAFSTKCVSNELQEMGKEYSKTLVECRSLKLHKCSHDTPVPASQCLRDQIGEQNGDKW